MTVAHGARAFFQGNRYMLLPLVEDVVARIEGPVLDLYAGVGLFALAAAAHGHPVTAVEGDPASAADLVDNAASGAGVNAVHGAVEAHLAGPRHAVGTVVVDPPRTGLSAEALAGVLAWAPAADRLRVVRPGDAGPRPPPLPRRRLHVSASCAASTSFRAPATSRRWSR